MKTKSAAKIQCARDEESQAVPGSVTWRRIEEFRTATLHKELSTVAALDFCVEQEVTPPRWLVEAAAELMIELLKSQKTSNRGRSPTYLAQYCQHLIDVKRWDAVFEIRRIREDITHESKVLSEMSAAGKKPHERRKRHIERFRDWLRHGTFQCAAMYLKGRDAHAGPDAIRGSYRRVSRAFSRGEKSPMFGDLFLKKLGLEDWLYVKPGTKRIPLYNLVP